MSAFTTAQARHATEVGDFALVNRFEVRIEGISIGEFQEVQVPEIEISQVEYHVGSSRAALKRPSQYKVGDLILKRGYAHNTMLFDWFKRVKAGDAERRNISIDGINEHGEVTMTFDVYHCWPKKWKLGMLDASKDEQMLEEVTIACEDYDRVK